MFSGPVQTAEDISRVGFALMASKALFAALHLGVFDALADGSRHPGDFAEGGGAVDRMTTLLTALVAAGLVETDGERFTNAPATQEFMSRLSGRRRADADPRNDPSVAGAPGRFMI